MLQINGKCVNNFVTLEEVWDNCVGSDLEMLIQRGNQTICTSISVQDLNSISPFRYLEFGGAILHELSYQMAKSFMVPFEGIYVAASGYSILTLNSVWTWRSPAEKHYKGFQQYSSERFRRIH